MTIIFITLVVFSLVPIIGTLLPLIPVNYWWIRWFDFPRVQIIVLALVLFIVFPMAGMLYYSLGLLLFFALAAVIFYQAAHIFSYTFLVKKQVIDSKGTKKTQTSFSLIIANILMDNQETEYLITLIKKHNPDFALLIETNAWWLNKLQALESIYQHQFKFPAENTYGMTIFSKYKLINPQIYFMVEKDVPSIHTEVEIKNGHRIKLYCIHPKPPVPLCNGQANSKTTKRDAELIKIARMASKDLQPVIVMGDLNDVAWSSTTKKFRRISGLKDPRIGRGFYNTFHAKYWFCRFPLDYIFHSKEFKLVRLQRLPYIGSDHFPMFIKLAL